jgi:hypothetical protein
MPIKQIIIETGRSGEKNIDVKKRFEVLLR